MQPDYQAVERILGLTIEGIDKEQQLLVRFKHIDLNDLGKEFSFVLDVSGPGYRGAWRLTCSERNTDLELSSYFIATLASTSFSCGGT